MNASTGRTFYRGESGYEAARSAAVKNGRKPERFPDIIVQAASDADVIGAVRLAKRNGLKIGVRSGGHSWAGAFLRDGGMLIDLSQMNAFTVEREARTATVQPGLVGTELNRALRKYDLFFPTGHCMNVGLGGFLLQGGFGWNSRLWGPACVSVRAIDVVTADGELWHADAKHSADLLWAARGAGPGFFGVVTKFYLDVFPRPKVFLKSDYVYPLEAYDDVLRFVHAAQPQLARTMECLIFTRRDILGHPGPGALLTAPVIADSVEEAREALAILETCPVRARAVMADVNAEGSLDQWLQAGEDLLYPPGARYAADNMWTSAPVEALLPGMRDIATSLPAAPSHMMWMLWGPPAPRPDMAFSMEDDLYIALYSVWQNPAEDQKHQAWVTEHMKKLEPLASGIQLADENLAARPFKFIADKNLARLEALRAKYDPGAMFHSYMAVPAPQLTDR